MPFFLNLGLLALAFLATTILSRARSLERM
jgi:hypothetical protein